MSAPIRFLTKKFVTLRRFHKHKRDTYYSSNYGKEENNPWFPSLLSESNQLFVIGEDAVNWNTEIAPTDRNLAKLQHHLDIFSRVQQNMEQYLIYGFYYDKNIDKILLCNDVCNIIALYLDYWNTIFIRHVYDMSYYNIWLRLTKEFAPKACISDRSKQYWRCLVRWDKDLSINTWNGRQIVWNLIRSRGSKLYFILCDILQILSNLDDAYRILHFDETNHWRFSQLKRLKSSSFQVVIAEEYLDRIDHYLEQNQINLARIKQRKIQLKSEPESVVSQDGSITEPACCVIL